MFFHKTHMQDDWNGRVEEAKIKNCPSDIMIYTRLEMNSDV